MKTQTKLLNIAISAILSMGLISVATHVDADAKSNTIPTVPDDNKRSKDDSGVDAHKKMTICHVPPGNPANAHTIHISANAWPAHDKNHPGDYVGSCNREASFTKESVTPGNNSTPAKREWTTTSVTGNSSTIETQHTVTGCAATYLTPLRKAVREFYEPVIVPDSALDDPTVAMAVSRCLNNGDSSDSGKSNADSSKSKDAAGRKTGGQGQARLETRDSVSDSGNSKRRTHYITGCKNKDTEVKSTSYNNSDSTGNAGSGNRGHKADSNSVALNNNHAQILRDTVNAYMHMPDSTASDHTGRSTTVWTKKSDVDARKGSGFTGGKEGERGIVVSDSALDDSDVKAAVKACAKKPNSDKIDSSKVGKFMGTYAHKYRIVKSCGTALDNNVKNAIIAYKAKDSNAPVVFDDSVLGDATIKSLFDACMSNGGKDNATAVTANITLSNTTVANATLVNRTVTGATVTGGETAGTQITPAAGSPTQTTNATIYGIGTANQIIVGGTTTGGAVALSYTADVPTGRGASTESKTIVAETINGVISGGTATGGTFSEGVITSGSGTNSSSVPTPVINASIIGGTLGSGSVTGGTYTNGTATGGTASVASGASVVTTGGIVTGGTVTGGTTTGTGSSAITTGATVTGGTVTGGTTTGLTISGATVTGIIQSGATVSGASITGAAVVPGLGTSGQINWRETNQ